MEDGEDGEDEDKGKVVVGFSEVSVESVALVMALETRTAEELAQDEVVEGAPEAVGTAMAVEGYTRPVLAKWGAVSGSNVGIAYSDWCASATATRPSTAITNFIILFECFSRHSPGTVVTTLVSSRGEKPD